MKNQKNKQGFTLIELLVVIAIIGLLATLSVVALNNARERARDTRRVSDVKQIQTALELYYNTNNGYPTDEQGLDILGDNNLMNPVPTPPTPDDCNIGDAYGYTVNAEEDEYCLEYCLANNTGGIDAADTIFATESTIDGGETCPHATE